MQWMVSTGYQLELGEYTDAMINAAIVGDVKVLQWLDDYNTEFTGIPQLIIRIAARKDNYISVGWLLDKQPYEYYFGSALTGALDAGNFDFIKWLRSIQLKHLISADESWRETIRTAASLGRLDIMKWAYEEKLGFPWGTSLCELVLFGCQLDVFIWLIEIGIPYSEAQLSYVGVTCRNHDKKARFNTWLQEHGIISRPLIEDSQ